MNNQQFGNAVSLMKYDLAFQLCKAFTLPLWYVTMITEPKEKNRNNKNNINYRLGSQNSSLFPLAKKIFFSDEATLGEITEYFKEENIDTKAIATRLNQKASHFKIGYITTFTSKSRENYFVGVSELIASPDKQLVLLDPDNGIARPKDSIMESPANKLISPDEIKMILGSISEDSIVVVNQMLVNSKYGLEQRIIDLRDQLQANVFVVADEVLQSGLVVITKGEGTRTEALAMLQSYLADYRSLKNSNRIALGYSSGDTVIIEALGSTID